MEKDFENLFQIEIQEYQDLDIPKFNPKFKEIRIQHLVLSGGSVWGLKTYGALRHAFSANFLQVDLIESIYATSVGSMIATVLCMKFDFATIDDYLIKRPWHKSFTVSPENLLCINKTWGIYTRHFMEEFFTPLFKAKGLSFDVTLAEFYEFSHIDLHIFTTEINSFQCIDLSHTTHPTWKLMDAIYGSCCVPVAFSPLLYENGCYIDGGIHMNYPLAPCIEKVGAENLHKIFGIVLPSNMDSSVETSTIESSNMTNMNGQSGIINAESSFFDYVSRLLGKLLESRLFINDLSYRIPYQMELDSQTFSIDFLQKLMASSEERKRMIDDGSSQMESWIRTLNNGIDKFV
jgi:predicted acylesterase/phospholipase RssA